MDLSFGWKEAAAVASLMVGLGGFVPYFIGIFKRKNAPHAYTWFIWSVTQGTATAGVIVGGGGTLASLNLGIGALACAIVFGLSFKFGTRNITRSDTLVFVAALAAILVWWQLENPVLAILMVAAIDGLGYLPTYRKLWVEPYSENVPSWALFALSPLLSLFALHEYNFLTVPYISTIITANVLLVVLALLRRSSFERPS
jgi:hypothetical protein